MFRAAPRALPRSFIPNPSSSTAQSFRHLSTQPPHLRSRSWKSSGLRWGLAVAGIYYYNTSPVFAEQPHHNLLNPNVDSDDESHAASVLDELTSRRSREAQKNHDVAVENATLDTDQEPIAGGAAELEEEAAGEGAFNPETGEINWDCPCLGGMAHGPCGPQFREAFSCFVYSQEEPKGMDCIERFQNMRDCFQEHPDVYKDELMEDEELDRELEAEKQELVSQIAERRRGEEAGATHRLLEESDPEPRRSSAPSSDAKSARQQESTPSASESQPAQSRSRTTATPAESSSEDRTEGPSSSLVRRPRPPPVSADAVPETEELIPKAAFDARSAENQRPPPKNA